MLPVTVSRVPRLHAFHDLDPTLLPPSHRLRGLGVKMEALERRLLRSAGDPDASFAGNGLLIHDLFGGTNGISAIVEDAQGRIYAAGHAPVSQEAANTDSSADPAGAMPQFWLGRFNADGSVDTTFGDNGSIYFTDPEFSAGAQDMAIQPDGKIVVQANIQSPTGEGLLDLGLIRFNPDGSVDTTFGDNGLTRTNTAGQEWSFDMAIGDDGSIVLAGSYEEIDLTTFTKTVSDLLVIKYTADGRLDTNFADGGILHESFNDDYTYATSVDITPDGKVIVAGGSASMKESALGKTYTEEFLVARYNADGTRDTTFGGGDGFATTDLGPDYGGGSAQAMVVDANGVITLAGRMLPENFENGIEDGKAAFVRFTADGTLDSSFGPGGVRDIPGGVDYAWNLIADDQGRLLLSSTRPQGYDQHGSYKGVGMRDEIEVSRYNSDGTLDESFGDGGFARIQTADEETYAAVNGTSADSLMVTHDGNILAGGTLHAPNGIRDGVLAKFLGDDSTGGETGGGETPTEEPETPSTRPEDPETPEPSGATPSDVARPTVDEEPEDVNTSVWSDNLLGPTDDEDEDLLAGLS